MLKDDRLGQHVPTLHPSGLMLLCHTHNHTHTHTCSLNYVFKAIRADYYRHVCLPFFKQSNWWNMIISVVLYLFIVLVPLTFLSCLAFQMCFELHLWSFFFTSSSLGRVDNCWHDFHHLRPWRPRTRCVCVCLLMFLSFICQSMC